MNKVFGNNKRKRIISFFLLISFVSEILTPTATFALTGGPSQPEVEAFTPINTSEMVDLTSGDFKYNIPLMDVGGYPLNIAYNSGIGMDQEASWVGLGWNLNVGAITRNMRGLPDDFNGESIYKEFNMKDNNTFGVNVGVGMEIFGYKKTGGTKSGTGGKLNVGLGLTYNNYTGIGMEQSVSLGVSAGESGKGSMNAGLGLKSSNSGGLTISPNVSFSYRVESTSKGDESTTGSASIGLGVSMNSRAGLKDLSFTSSYNRSTMNTKTHTVGEVKDKDGKVTTAGHQENDYQGSNSGGISSAGVINFGASTYIPQVHNSMVNNSVALSFKLGTTIFGLDGDITLGGYFSNQSLMHNASELAAYGYMFSHEGQQSDDVLMDFNREKDQSFSRYTKNLPITNYTYDVFSVSGQGIGGAYRPFRSDVGYMFDNSTTTTSDSYTGGVEFAATNTAHLGVNISVVDVHTTTGKWSDDNEAKGELSSQGSIAGNKTYEPYYFREVGEKSENDAQDQLYNDLGADDAYRVQIYGFVNHTAKKTIENSAGATKSLITPNNYIPYRQKRNQVISTLNYDEAKLYGLDRSIYNGSSGMHINSAYTRGHNIAEMTVLRTDGSRYVYGLPAYNTKQLEVTFNASDKTTSSNNPTVNSKYQTTSGYVTYNATDRSKDNSNGIDHYFNSVAMPSYAHSYLLTSIVSPDYVDLTGDGPSDDDFGNYTKFTYTNTPDYNWRMPFDANSANFNENGKSIENDDNGSFVTGSKELWFTTQIETKNYIAIFDLADRDDAIGAAGENGGVGTKRTKYINKISLYSKPEYNASPGTAVPIKVVHFEYDYSLCTGIPNNTGVNPTLTGLVNQGGKLTLKSIYFTYGKSDKAAFSKYAFNYGQLGPTGAPVSNFKYHPKAFDRWGNYMPVNNKTSNYNYTTLPSSNYAYGSDLTNSEFPYTDQMSKADADYRASAWNLSQINLPSGGSININYESDDYAFVQNRPAMQMMKVIGIGSLPSDLSISQTPTIDKLFSSVSNNNLYLKFELTQPVPSTVTTAGQETDLIRRDYLKDINSTANFLYFRFLVNLTNTDNTNPLHTNAGDHFEYVSGYAELFGGATPECGMLPSSVILPNGHRVGYVKLKDVVMDDKTSIGSTMTINPIAKAALNFGKSHYNNIVWDASFSPPSDIIGAVKQLASEAMGGFAKTMMQNIKGPNLSLAGKGYCQQFVLGKSWIRLYNPNGHKFGGGSRVKELTIKDNWSAQTPDPSNSAGQGNSEYGQVFTYETEFGGNTISSGVASYEPMLGGDENPFRQPVFMGPNNWSLLTPDERFFMEEPFGETFFPSASISYSKVKVKNKIPANVNVKTHGTGYVVHEFYTAKDYPTITSHTPIDPHQYKPALGSLLKVCGRDYVAATQGYVIKLNDMHGKQKAQAVYAEGSLTPLSRVDYFYKTKGGQYTDYGLRDINSDATCTPNELDNTCIVIKKDGSIASRTIGMDFDAVADFRESETTTIMGGAQINLSMFLVGVFPGLVPTIWPDFSYEKTRFRSSVLTKVISNYGILETTTAQDLGSKVTTSNLAYDAQTGDVLVTKTKNDFEDNIYSLKYPSFWGYDLMGPAYKNIGLADNVNFNGTGVASTGNPENFYNIGDEIALGGGNVGWICGITPGVLGNMSVMDKAGNYVTNSGPTDIKVLRSGRRNLLSSQMSSLTSLVNPLDNNNDGILDAVITINTNNKVLNTSAIEYSDQWQTFKGYDNSTAGACNCTVTQAAIDWKAFLNKLLLNNKLLGREPVALGCPNPPFATVYYPEWTNSSISSGWYTGNCNPEWSTQLEPATTYTTTGLLPNILYGAVNNHVPFDVWYNQVEVWCKTGLALPAGLNWSTFKDSLNYNPAVSVAPVLNFAANVGDCVHPKQVNMILTIHGVNYPVIFGSQCHILVNCVSNSGTGLKCGIDAGDKVNPFVFGIRGNWRPKTTWSYLDSRTQTTGGTNNNLDIRKDGYITSYTPFYTLSSGAWVKTPSNWTYTSEISKMTPNGVEVENKDALNRYSSALYGYRESLPLAVASNAQLQEIAFDGFEDYNFSSGACDIYTKEHHFDFYAYKTSLDNTNSHTGKYSMKVNPNSNISIAKSLMSADPIAPQLPACNYVLRTGDFIYPFTPITNHGAKRYILSYWVKENSPIVSSVPVLNYSNSLVNLYLSGGSGFITGGTLKRSNIIDGWQRFEYDFTISAGATGKINIALANSSATNSSFFDDIRIHPYNSNMKSFVYNPVTLKYVAELDANNFATFYEYDEEGSLVRVKKETEKGIMTIQETKNHTKK